MTLNGGPWTRHGHAVEGFTVDGPGRPPVARCGGPALCRKCWQDAERIRGAAEPIITPQAITEKKETIMNRKIIFAVHLDNGEVLTSVPIEGDDEVNRTLQIVENFTTKTSIAFALSDTLRVTVSAKRIAYITSQAVTEDGGAP